jgi:hypothetical protein
MTLTEKMAEYNTRGFRYVMRIYWDDICVAIKGYISESEFYSDYITEMDNLPSGDRIEVTKNW